MDIPMEGGNYTWSNSLSRYMLDKLLSTPATEEHYSKMVRMCLPQLLSDHFSVLLERGSMQWGLRPYRFEYMWLKAKGFTYKGKWWWDSYQFQGFPSYMLANKLKALKLDLTKWSLEI